MTKKVLYFSLLIILIQSCGSSSSVTNNFSIQKRKYNKGWNVKELFQHKLKSNVSETKTIEKHPINATQVEENSTETTALSVPVSIPSSSNEINANKEIDGESNILIDQKESTLEETIQIQQNEIENPIEKDEDPTESVTSPELKKFNKYHKTMVILLFGALVTFLISLFPLYVMLIIQRFKNAKAVPMEERDEYYYRKKIFAGVFFILGTILLTIFLTGLVAGLILLSM